MKDDDKLRKLARDYVEHKKLMKEKGFIIDDTSMSIILISGGPTNAANADVVDITSEEELVALPNSDEEELEDNFNGN